MDKGITERQKELFTRWKESYSQDEQVRFVTDGVFCEDEWKKQPVKILFVLKETDGAEPAKMGLCDYLLSEVSAGYWKTWNNVARWTQALMNEDIDGSLYQQKVSKADKTHWLKKIAAINLKKLSGGASADTDQIKEYAVRDASLLREQIKLYDPDIILCCGRGEGKNADILHDTVLQDEVGEWGEKVGRYNYFLYSPAGKGKQVPVVSFVHPQMRGGHALYKERYCDMIEIRKALCHYGQK